MCPNLRQISFNDARHKSSGPNTCCSGMKRKVLTPVNLFLHNHGMFLHIKSPLLNLCEHVGKRCTLSC